MREGCVIIVGSGIVGLSTAWELAQRGRRVVVLDRAVVHDQASCGNAGMLSFGHVPLTRPGVSWRGLRWMLSRTSPLYIRPTLDREVLSWLWTFHRHCTQSWMETTMVSLCEQGWASMRCIERFMEASSAPCLFKKTGWIAVCMTDDALNEADHEGHLVRPMGYTCDRVSGAELRRRNSCFSPNIAGAIHWRDSAICDPRAYMRALAKSCGELGVSMRSDADVQSVLLDKSGAVRAVALANGEVIDASTIVIAGGVWSKSLLELLGISTPLQGARGYNVRLEGVADHPETACVLAETFIAVTPTGHALRLAGTLEIGPLGKPWLQSRLDALRTGARRYIPGVEMGAVTEEWAGYRPALPDGMPAVGAIDSIPGLLVGTGHAMLGMTLGPIAGRALSQLVIGEKPEIDLSLMRPDRFGHCPKPRRAAHAT
ncbi:MAG: FAD-dependent oxidoreductase [Planctomycetota bacterium]|nr:FAD-dependent oxidoreductase [Planctomycetota bacterium]